MTSSDFESTLIDVRKAYRLLYLYQRRVMDLVQFIGDSLSFHYTGGWSWFSDNTPKGGKGSLDNWAWDWINMYFYEFNFSTREIKGNEINFSIIIQSDTGFYDSESDTQLDIGSFLPPENAATKLIFLIGKNCWHEDHANDFKDQSLLYRKELHNYIKKTDTEILLAKPFYLTDFLDLDKTLNCLQEWVNFCKLHGITEIEVSK